MKRILVLLHLFAIVSFCIIAQNIQRFEYYGSEHGLSQNNAYSVTCDRNGFIWVGTMNGLNRFDGRSFQYFTDDTHSHNNRVLSMWTDKADHIWAQTYDGIYEYLDQRHEEFGILPLSNNGEAATAFVQYSDSVVFVGSERSGLYELTLQSDGRYAVNTHNVDKYISGLYKTAGGSLWIMTNSGVACIDRDTILSASNWQFCFAQDSISFTGVACESRGRTIFGTKSHGIIQYDAINHWEFGNQKSTVTHLLSIDENRIFASTSDAESYIIDISDHNSSHLIKCHGYHQTPVTQTYLDRHKQIWVVTDQPGVSRIDVSSMSSTYYQLVPSEIAPTVDLERPFFAEDNKDNLWIGLHGGGLMMYDRNADSFIAYHNDVADSGSIPSDLVHSITMDNSGHLWLGTGQYRGGLVKVVTGDSALKNIQPVAHPRSQADNVVRAIAEDPSHNIWSSTKGGKLFVYDSNGSEIRSFSGFETISNGVVHSLVYSILVDSHNYLWLGTKGIGLLVSESPVDFDRISASRLRFRLISTASKSISLTNNNVYGLTEDKDGNIWVATYGGGLTRLAVSDKGEILGSRVFSEENSNLLDNKVRYVLSDRSGNLWVATTSGVCRAKVGVISDSSVRFDHFVHNSDANSLSYNDVCHIYEGHDGDLYFSTIGGGLDALSMNPDGSMSYTHYSISQGLCNNAVYGVAQTSDNSLWVATENGLAHIDRRSNVIENFNDDSGLNFNAFSESTVCNLSEDRVALGGYQGFVIVSPQELMSAAHNYPIVFTHLQIDGQDVSIGTDEESAVSSSVLYADRIRLNSNQNSFTIDYTTLDYANQKRINYSYRLLGLENEWNNVGTETRASYTNLSPGSYTLEVRHTYSAGGEWLPDVKRIEILVDAPWYKTPWAKFLYVLSLAAFIYIITRGISRINKYRHELKLEKRLNDVKLQFFTNIAHEIRTPLTLIVAPIDSLNSRTDLPAEVQRDLKIVKRSTNRLLLLIGQLLDFRKVQNKKMNLQVSEVNLGNLVTEVSDSFRLLADHKHLSYDVEIPANLSPVWVDPKEIDTVIYNILSNAMKFTDEGKSVKVTLRQDMDNSYIGIIDEGCGMSEAEQQQLFKRYTILSSNALSGTGIGLSLAYELIKLHGGDISVHSVKGMGSTFIIRIPNGRAHLENMPHVSFVDNASSVSRPAVMPSITDSPEDVDVPDNADKKSMLIVEDNTEILNYLSQTLSPYYRCRRATNGSEALLLVEAEHPDIIMTDLMMPVMDGTTMIRNLKDNFETSHIPIIALTAKSAIEDQIDVLRLGVDAFIPKPFNVEHIKTVLDNILKRKEQLAARIAGLALNQSEGAQLLKNYDEQGTSSSVARVQPEGQEGATSPQSDLSYITIQSKDEKFLEELVHFTEEKYKEDLTIDDFAAHFYMSRTVFYNKVKGLTGNSPLEFVRQIKFKIAAELLRNGYNVSEVAFEIGYSDVKYFSRQFKAQFGYAPSQVKSQAEK